MKEGCNAVYITSYPHYAIVFYVKGRKRERKLLKNVVMQF